MIAFILDVYVTQISIKQRKMGLSSHIDQPAYDEQGRTPSYAAGNLQNNNTNTWNFEEQENEDSPFIKPKPKSSKYTELSPSFRKDGDKND